MASLVHTALLLAVLSCALAASKPRQHDDIRLDPEVNMNAVSLLVSACLGKRRRLKQYGGSLQIIIAVIFCVYPS